LSCPGRGAARSEATWCAADTGLGFTRDRQSNARKSGKPHLRGPLRTELLAVPDQRCTAPLRGVYPRAARSADPGTLRRIRDTRLKTTRMGNASGALWHPAARGGPADACVFPYNGPDTTSAKPPASRAGGELFA